MQKGAFSVKEKAFVKYKKIVEKTLNTSNFNHISKKKFCGATVRCSEGQVI